MHLPRRSCGTSTSPKSSILGAKATISFMSPSICPAKHSRLGFEATGRCRSMPRCESEQIVSVLSSASFHRLPLPSIEPSDIIVVPGQTPEGTWPLVKLTNFGLPRLTLRTEIQSAQSETRDEALSTGQVAGSEQPAHATDDIRSEISSLG